MMRAKMRKNTTWHAQKGIALLITVFFVMAITVALGVGLKQVKEATSQVEAANFMLQSNVILEDVLSMLKNSKEFDVLLEEKSPLNFFGFLSSVAFIPFESSGLKVSIQIKSARAKLNPNTLTKDRSEALREYLSRRRVNPEYVSILLDVVSGIKEDYSYNSGIFNEKPSLFRSYLASREHLLEVNDFYTKTYHENTLENIDFENLFYISKQRDAKIDLNYATPQTWELMLGCSDTRAQKLSLDGGTYEKIEDLSLSDDEKNALQKFQTSFFEPYLEVVVEMQQNAQSAKIRFEYDITTKKGSNFAYTI